MYYIFDKNGECVASCNYQPYKADCDSRSETFIETVTIYDDISKIALVEGVITNKVIPAPTPVQIQANLTACVQGIIDAKAREKNYDDGVACASYATSTNEKFKAEATDFISWRDVVWSTCYLVLDDALLGKKYNETWANAIPTETELLEALPVLKW